VTPPSAPPQQPASGLLKPDAAAWLGLSGMALLFLALRWNSFNVPLIRDEGEYAYAGNLLRHGLAPYQHAFLQKPPMVAYTYAVAGFIAPHLFWFPRLLAFAFVGLATGLLGHIARLEFGRGIAMPAMWLFVPMVLLPEIDQFTANTEMFLLLPLLATLAVYVRSRHFGCQRGQWVSAGALAAATFWYKYTALPALMVIFFAWSFEEWRARKSLGWLWRRWFFAVAGAAAASLGILALFLATDGAQSLWDCTIRFNRYYASSSSFGWFTVTWTLKSLWTHWRILFFLPLLLLVSRRPRAVFWFAMLVASWLPASASIYGQYYVPVMPFWAVLNALALQQLAKWTAGKTSFSEEWLRRIFTAVVVVLVCLPDVAWMKRSKEQFAAGKFGGSPFAEAVLAGKRAAELTLPQDYVFVAGSEPEILVYAERFSPSRFVIAYPLMFPTPLAAEYQHEAIRELRQHPPAVIVFAASPLSWMGRKATPPDFLDFLHRLLASDYEMVGGYVVDDHTRRWSEPLAEQDVAKATLIVSRRKDR
jgi:hypothetical protein